MAKKYHREPTTLHNGFMKQPFGRWRIHEAGHFTPHPTGHKPLGFGVWDALEGKYTVVNIAFHLTRFGRHRGYIFARYNGGSLFFGLSHRQQRQGEYSQG